MIFTLFAMSLVPTVELLQILRIEAYYTLPWFQSTQHKKQNSHSVRHRRERVCQNSPLGHRFGRRHGHRFFSCPRKQICSPKQICSTKKTRRAFGASATLAWRRLSNKTKFESRTGPNVAAASAASNTERATERGGRTLDEQHRPFYLGGL